MALTLKLNSKGQAAMMDAIYLLVIVATLSVVLFNFSSSYGNTVSNYLSSQYGVDFVTSALKTILYSSVPKDTASLEDSKEIDYLLAFLKQDYASSSAQDSPGFLSPKGREVLRQSVKTAMSPMSSRYDYTFFIQETQGGFNFVFIYLRLSTIEGKQVQVFKEGVAVLESACPKGVKRVYPNDSSSPKDHREYYCTAKNEGNINRMLQNAGDVSRTFTGITLGELRGASISTVSARADLIMWLPTCIEVGNQKEPLWVLDQETPFKQVIREFNDNSKPWYNNGEGKLVCFEVSG